MHIDKNYHQLLQKILDEGYWYDDPNREGVKRLEISSHTFKHEFKDGFPAVSTAKLFYKSVVTELLWFLCGDTNIKYLVDRNCNIWNKDAYKYYCSKFLEVYPQYKQNLLTISEFIETISGELNSKSLHNYQGIKNYTLGDLGPVYGHQWVNTGNNQILQLIKNMIEKPMSSELVVNAWNATELEEMALQPCHYGFQVVMRPLFEHEISSMIEEKLLHYYHLNFKHHPNIRNDIRKELPKYGFELHWNQRSVDTFLGSKFNIASYATLALILQKITGHKALAIQGDLKKVHLYDNSINAANEQLIRESNNKKVNLLMKDEFHYLCDLTDFKDFDYFKFINELENDFFILENYEPHPAIKVEMLERS